MESKHFPIPDLTKLNNLFYTVSKDLIYNGYLKLVERGTYYANSAGIAELDEEIISGAEEGEIIEDEELDTVMTRVVGNGKAEVYVYYYPTYLEMAELKGEKFFRCKVGMTSVGVERRFGRSFCTDAPERRCVALRIRTDFPEEVEKYLHAAMKSAGRSCPNTYGREWFMTNPDEILSIYTSMSSILGQCDEEIHEEPMYTTV